MMTFEINPIPFTNLYAEGDATPPTPPTPPADGGAPKDFTPEQQAIFNKAMAEERRKAADRIKSLEENLKKANLTGEQAKVLETELENARASIRTTEEQAAHERTQLTKKHQQELEERETRAKTWESRYTNMAISNSLLTAATENNAFNPTQLVQILKPNTRLVEVVGEDGKKTGELAPKVKISLPNEKGEMVELDLAPSDAVKRMAAAAELYGNLFKSNATGGVGGNPNNTPGNAKETDMNALAKKDPAAYIEARKKERAGSK